MSYFLSLVFLKGKRNDKDSHFYAVLLTRYLFKRMLRNIKIQIKKPPLIINAQLEAS